MMRYIKSNQAIDGGVRPKDETDFEFDYTYDYPEDIIHLTSKSVYYSEFKSHLYWFGYVFNEDVSSSERTKFIHYLKGIGESKISDFDLQKFIEIPLNDLHRKANMYSMDCFVYPVSGRSNLVQRMIEVIGEYSSRDMKRCSFELVKSAPSDIEFDWEYFESEVPPGTNRYAQMSKYVNDVVMPAIHELDYFSLAKNVKPKYRKYIKDFLNFSDKDIEKLSKLKGQKILVVDDINTSGSTLNEILRILQKINPGCDIYIYTLIGNFKRN